MRDDWSSAKSVTLEAGYDTRRAWERLEGEGSKAYNAFCIYRDMEADERTIVGAFRQYVGRDVRYPSGYALKWARRFKWRERALLYDDYKEAIVRKHREATIVEAAKRHATQCKNYGAILNAFESILMKRLKDNPSLEGVTLTDLMNTSIRGAAILPKLQEAEMTALGKPKRVEVTGEGGGPVLHRYLPPTIIDEESPDAESGEDHVRPAEAEDLQ